MDFSKLDEGQLEIIDEVYCVFGQFSAWKLRNMTHAEPPWTNAPRSEEITHEAMRQYFKTLVVDAEDSLSAA